MVKNKTLVFVRLLLGVFTFQLILPFILVASIFFVKQNQQKIIENYALHQHLFVTISLDSHEFDRLIGEKDEFIHHGNLYDIHSIRKKNGKYLVKAVKDDNEKKLKILNHEAVKKNSRSAVKLLKHCNCICVFFEKSYAFNNALQLFKVNYKLFRLKLMDNPYLKIPSPPPDFC